MNVYFNVGVCLIAVLLTVSLKPSESTSSACSGDHATGSVLFHNKKCWQHEDLALLSSRKILQNLIPTNELDVSNDGYITNLIDYFHMCFSMIQKMSSGRSQDILLLALADAIGGYLHYYVIPVTKGAFYSGNVRYDRATKLFSFFDDIKVHLDTNGKRWAAPMDTSKMEFKTRALTVTPPCQEQDPCASLLMNDKRERGSRECTGESDEKRSPIPMPYLDDAAAPTAIAVPFRASSLLPLAAPRAAFILEKYYVTAAQCLMSQGGDGARDDLAEFDTFLYRWLQQTVVPRLRDEQWYPAFGGVRKILKTIKSRGLADSSLSSEDTSAGDQSGGGMDADVQEDVEIGEGSQSSIVTWSLLVAVGFGTLTAWIGMALICACMRCNRRRKEGGRPNDEQYKLINTFVQIFYDKQGCGKNPELKDSFGPSAIDGRRESTPGSDRRQSSAGNNRRQSTPGIERRESTPSDDRRDSMPGNKRRQSTPGNDRRQSTPSADRRQSASWNSENQDQKVGSDQEYESDNERTPMLNRSDTRVRSGSMFGKPRRESTMYGQVQSTPNGSTNRKYQKMEKMKSVPSSAKEGRGKTAVSAGSSRKNSESTVSEMVSNSDSPISSSDSEDVLFTNNGS